MIGKELTSNVLHSDRTVQQAQFLEMGGDRERIGANFFGLNKNLRQNKDNEWLWAHQQACCLQAALSLLSAVWWGEVFNRGAGTGKDGKGGIHSCIRGTPAAQRSGCEDSLVDPVGRPLVRTH